MSGAALVFARRGVSWPAPQAMLVLGLAGMAVGLTLDLQAMAPGALASVCAAADRELWSTLRLHWRLLPWMHVGMAAGGLAAIVVLRQARPGARPGDGAALAGKLACLAWMTVGMSIGGLATGRPGDDPATGAAVMLAGMFAGMAIAMAAYATLGRLVAGRLARIVNPERQAGR